MNKTEFTEVRLPIYWASYLVNNDASGLEDGEEDQVQETLEHIEYLNESNLL